MSLAKDEKAKIVKKFGKSAKDTGSTATQVALLTKRIEELQSHFKKHNKDNHSKTASQVKDIITLADKLRVKVIFGGSGIHFLPDVSSQISNTFNKYSELEKII